MKKELKINNDPISLLDCIFLVFMTLKLIGTIDWSWWWITAPLWIPMGFGFVLILITSIYKAIKEF